VINTIESVEKTVIGVVADLIQDWGLDLDEGVGGQSRLVNDLDFSSVDIIQLCVALEQHYERKLGFQDLLMHDGSYVADLSLAQVSKFVLDRLNGG
jgi:acyl carrier protein